MLYYDIYNNKKEKWLVFLHGIGGDNYTWKKQVEYFSKDYNIVLIELHWHGHSEKIEYDTITKQDVSIEIRNILDKEKIDKAYFIALSLGTIVLSHFIERYGEYVEKAVYTSSVIRVNALCNIVVSLFLPLKRILPYKTIYKALTFVVAPSKRYNDIRKMFIKGYTKMPRKYLIEWFRYMGSVLNGKNVVENIKAQDKDILFISGSSDFIFLGGAKKTAKQLHKEIKLLNGCCHICNWDGCDEYNKLVDEFLKR